MKDKRHHNKDKKSKFISETKEQAPRKKGLVKKEKYRHKNHWLDEDDYFSYKDEEE